MKKGKKSESEILRQKAEELLKKKQRKTDVQLSETQTLKLIHELEVCQIELELQNEELTLAKSNLQKSSEKYTELYDFAPSGYFTLSKEGKIIELNLMASRLLGKDHSSLVGNMFQFFVSESTKPVFNEFLTKVFSSKQKESCEIILTIPNKSPVYVYMSGIINKSENHCFITSFDISHRKYLEEEIKINEEKFRSIFEGAVDGILYLSKNLTVLEVNRAFSQITRIQKEDVIGKSGFNLAKKYVDLEQLPRLLKILKEIVSNKPIVLYEIYYNDKVIEIRSSKQVNGNHITILRDVTAQKQAIDHLLESQVYNQSLFDTLPLGLAITTMDGTLVDFNPAYGQIIGRTIEGCKKLTYWDITPNEYNEKEKQQLESLNKTGKYGPYEKEYIHKDGHLVPVSLQGKIIERDGTKYIWSSAEDITKRKRIENDFRQKAELDMALAQLYLPLISPISNISDIALIIKTYAQQLTKSRHCYVATIDPLNGDLLAHTLTEMMKDGQCAVIREEKKGMSFSKGKDGSYGRLWGHSLNTKKAFYTNDVKNHHASKGIPEGHINIEKFLSVPVILDQELVGQIGLANPKKDYTEKDIIVITRLAEFFAMAIRKQQFLDDLKARSKELELFNSAMLDREMRIIELKEEVNNLCKELNKPIRFPAIWDQKDD